MQTNWSLHWKLVRPRELAIRSYAKACARRPHPNWFFFQFDGVMDVFLNKMKNMKVGVSLEWAMPDLSCPPRLQNRILTKENLFFLQLELFIVFFSHFWRPKKGENEREKRRREKTKPESQARIGLLLQVSPDHAVMPCAVGVVTRCCSATTLPDRYAVGSAVLRCFLTSLPV